MPFFLFSHPSCILWLYYTTDGEAVALIVGALRAQARRVEVQEPSVGTRVDLRLPVVAAATPIVQITARPTEVASAEEGEGSRLYPRIIIRHIICIHKILIATFTVIAC